MFSDERRLGNLPHMLWSPQNARSEHYTIMHTELYSSDPLRLIPLELLASHELINKLLVS